jgi:hypothetical protein
MTCATKAAASTMETRLRDTARIYGQRGLAAMPLVLDPDGNPKRPMFEDGGAWLRFRVEDNLSHPWDQADGLGIILGAPSGNLGVVDVDDERLTDAILRHYAGRADAPLMCRTPHGLHLYTVEPQSSVSVDLLVSGRGWAASNPAKVQLLGRTRQAAAPPTRGYRWIDAKAAPAYAPLGASWHRLAGELGLYYKLESHGPKRGREWSRRLP